MRDELHHIADEMTVLSWSAGELSPRLRDMAEEIYALAARLPEEPT